MKLSIVATLYQSAAYIPSFVERASQAARELVGDDYEIVLVNDGSPDHSAALAAGLAEQDTHLVVVDLARNFGHHPAMMTGLAHACGERVFLLDSDLEEEPEWLTLFDAEMRERDCDVVFGVQAARKGGIFERWSGSWFFEVFRFFTRMPLPDNLVTARLMRREYGNALLQYDEREVYIAGLWMIAGFRQHAQTIKKHSTSETTYTMRKKIAAAVNAITSFSSMPLTAIFYIGFAISCAAGLYTSYVILNRLFFGSVSGWSSLIASVWLLGGLIILFIGIVGIYLSKVFAETKRRPYAIVRRVYAAKPRVPVALGIRSDMTPRMLAPNAHEPGATTVDDPVVRDAS